MMLIKKRMKKVRHKYIVKYNSKHDYKVKYSIGDVVRIYQCKTTFTKQFCTRFTDKVFKEREVKKILT